jgi:phage terminase large subunit-like protein
VKRPARASSTKAPKAPAPLPRPTGAAPSAPALPPYLDPRFATVNKGLTLTAAHFEKLVARGCWYDAAAAERIVVFFKNYTRHSKGEWAGQPITLELWQEYHWRNVFGWKRPNGTRVFRVVYKEIPRKNGKSTELSGIGSFLLTADDEEGAEVYSAANDREQAAIVFDAAASMVKKSPALAKRCKVHRRAITVPAKGASYKVLSADVQNKDGFNSHGILFDEVHKQKTRDLWDVLLTSTGSRRQPLTIAITTAGFDQTTICWELHEYARKIAEGVLEDYEFYPIIYSAGKDEDWKSPEVWRKANPNLGVSIKEDYLRELCQRAQNEPAFENTFRRNHLNQWTSQRSRWIPMDQWRKLVGAVDREQLAGSECFGGLDLASKIDIAALVLAFPYTREVQVRDELRDVTGFKLLPFFWIPEDNLQERMKEHGVRYDLWIARGLVRTTPGNVIDYAFIQRDIEELAKVFRIRDIGFDPYGAVHIASNLQAEGIEMVEVRQGPLTMSPANKEFMRLILSGLLEHGGNEVLSWMADNVVAVEDAKANILLDKSKKTKKIDGIVAAVMATDRARRNGAGGASVYEERGFTNIGGAA